MNTSAIISFFQSRSNNLFLLTASFYVAIGFVTLQEYFDPSSAAFLLGIVALFTVVKTQKGTTSMRYAYVAIAFAAIGLIVAGRTSLYFAIGAALLFAVESFYGKTRGWPLLVLGLMSPLFGYFTDVFSFPIRLELTSVAAKMLSFGGMEAGASGNIIYTDENEFAVDPACMGLNMMVTSILLAVMLISIFQRRYKKRISVWQTALLLASIILMNIFSNLFRILCLVIFAILPGTFMHDAVGIMCLLIYVMIPGSALVAWFVKRFGRSTIPIDSTVKPVKKNRQMILQGVVAVCIAITTINMANHRVYLAGVDKPVPSLYGYTVTRIAHDVLKLENQSALIYTKSIPVFYSTDHHPMTCWKGSGYIFQEMREQPVAGGSVYTALLTNGNERLYTAWWYDNGLHQTIDQAEWRFNMLTGKKPYFLVNVTASTEAKLFSEIKKMRKSFQFDDFLQSLNNDKKQKS